MSDFIRSAVLTIPAGHGSGQLYINDVPLGISDVEKIDLVFPPGCSGLVGVRIEFAINPVYPTGSPGFFILDDDRIQIPVSNQGNSGQWRLTGYNQDAYVHSVYAYFYYNMVDSAPSSSSSLVSL